MYRRLAIATACLLLAAPVASTADNPFGEEDCFAHEAYVTPDTDDPDVAGEFSEDLDTFLLRLQELHDNPPENPEDTGICVPGVGGPVLLSEESQQEFSWPGTPLWGETDTESGESSVPESTPFLELFTSQERLDTMMEALTENQLLELLRGWPAPLPPYPANRTYDIKIIQVDTSEFPIINIRFRVFLYDTAPPSFAVYANDIIRDVQITEELLVDTLTSPQTVTEFPDNKFTFDAQDGSEACYPDKPVVMGIAIDASGSLAQRVKNELLPNSQAYVDWIMHTTEAPEEQRINPEGDPRFDPPTPGDNQLAFFLFSSRVNERAPTNQTPADNGNYLGRTEAGQFQARYNELKETTGEGGSPIFESMRYELERLAEHDADCGISKILVSLGDFADTSTGDEQKNRLLELANANDIFMANLLFGDPDWINEENAEELAANDRGVVVQNANQDPKQAFYDLHMGAARTYCLRYKTPFPDRWNDVVKLKMTLPARENRWDESEAEALYPLPIVVPEDTEKVSVFFPLSDFVYTRFAHLGDKLGMDGELELKYPSEPTARFPVIDPEAFPVREVGSTGIVDLAFEGGSPGPFVPPNPATGAGLVIGFANSPYTSLDSASRDRWDAAFRVPTSRLIDLASGEVSPVSSGIHYAARVKLRNVDFTEGDCNITVGDAIVAVQDRTPPSVFVKLSPEQGQIPNLLHIYERGADDDAVPRVDVDPWPLGPNEPYQDYDQDDGDPNNDVITEMGAKSFGFGRKRARIHTSWVVGTGDEMTVLSEPLDQVPWSEPLFFDHETDPDSIPDFAAIPEAPEALATLAPFEPTEGGIRIPADVRVAITVRARDNFAGLANIDSGYRESEAGRHVWVDPLHGVGDEDPPLHAQFDFDDPKIYREDRSGELFAANYPGRNVAPPYLPILTRTEMEEEPNRSGVCWWIESVALPDRFRGGDSEFDRIDNVEFFQYSQSDEQEENGDLDVQEAVLEGATSLRQLHVWARDEHGNSTRFEIPIRIMDSDFKATAILNQGGRR